MIASYVHGLLEKSVNYLAHGGLGQRLARGAAATAGSVRNVPLLGRMVPAASPLHLFDMNQATKAVDNLGALGEGNLYFGGRSMKIDPSTKAHTFTDYDPGIGRSRMIGAGALGGLMAANMVGFDPMGITSAGSTMAVMGGHAFIGSTLYRSGGKTKMLGMAYLGLLGINTLRQGDNLGPL